MPTKSEEESIQSIGVDVAFFVSAEAGMAIEAFVDLAASLGAGHATQRQCLDDELALRAKHALRYTGRSRRDRNDRDFFRELLDLVRQVVDDDARHDAADDQNANAEPETAVDSRSCTARETGER
jgi:hypothetical protein